MERKKKEKSTNENICGCLVSNQSAITLVSLVITIILMLILAGIVLSLTIGENGIIKTALKATEEYKKAEANEKKDLNELYSSIKVAGDSKVTLTLQELDEYINSKMQSPKTNKYICNTTNDTGVLSVNSMAGLARTMDEENRIAEYLLYSDKDGYTVLKSGWYFVRLRIFTNADMIWDQCSLSFMLNENSMGGALAGTREGAQGVDENCFSVFLSQGDKIYFQATSYQNVAGRNVEAYCYPMF